MLVAFCLITHMLYDLRSIKDADVKNKTVFLRADLDIPLENGKIKDDTRLKVWFPTLEFLLTNKARVLIAGHLGRPTKQFSILNSQFSISEPQFSLLPVAEWISKRFEINDLRSKNFAEFKGWEISENIVLLENLRFYKEEEENPLTSSGQIFAQKLASLADIYVNDAFASSHRAHVSIVGITKYLPSYAGLRLKKEIEELSKVLQTPKRPLCVIIGGAKIDTKLPLVEKMHSFADYVLVGGEIAENDKVLLKVAHEKLNPPANGKKSALLVADLTPDLKDITIKSAENFLQIIQNAETIVWNGPMGYIDEKLKIKNKKLQAGDEGYTSFLLSYGIINSGAYTIVGGGDTVSFLNSIGILDKFSFVSTGGGAMLEFLAGEVLPGIKALQA